MLYILVLTQLLYSATLVHSFEFIDLFHSGKSNNSWSQGRVCYRIPSLLKINDTVLIAFAAERLWQYSNQSYCSDESASNIVSRRSMDGGVTWGAMELVLPTGDENAERHPWTLYDGLNERVFLFSNANVDGCQCDVLYMTSDDFGVTWSKATNIDSSSGYYGMSLAHGIQHTTGRLVGCMRKICRNSCEADYHSKSYYSDDGGLSWSASEWLTTGTTECQLIELPDSRLYLNSRPYKGWEGEKNVRLSSYSEDAGTSWSAVQPESELIDFGFAVEGSMASDVNTGIVVFVHPFAKTRRNMTLYKGQYDGDELSSTYGRVLWDGSSTIQLYAGLSEYSDVIVLNAQNKSAGVLFERSEFNKISFANVNLD